MNSVASQSSRAALRNNPGREWVRWLYLPWVWLVFIPFLAVTTIIFGTLAVLLSFISKRIAFHSGTIWAFLLCCVNFTIVRIRGRERADKDRSYIIVCNHQSHFDVLAFYALWGRQFRWVIKQELRKVPGLGWGCEAVGHIFVDRSNPHKAIASLEAARPLLAGGISALFFPEGSRSADGRLGRFKKGAFMMALQMGLPILPVTIRGSHRVLPGKTLWLRPGIIDIEVHEPVDVSAYGVERRDELIRDVRKVIASSLPEWQRGEAG